MSNDSKRADLRAVLKRAREEHERVFGEELVAGELNHFFSSLLEFKRRKWIEASLGDHGPEELRMMLELVEEGPEEENQGATISVAQGEE